MTMNFDPDMNPVGTTGEVAPQQQASGPVDTSGMSTEELLNFNLKGMQELAGVMIHNANPANFENQVIGFDGLTGKPVYGFDTAGFNTAIKNAYDASRTNATTLAGMLEDGAGGPGGISASALAQIAAQDRQLAESIRQFDITEGRSGREFADTMAFNREDLAATTDYRNKTLAQQEQQQQEEQRRNNLSSTLDLLTNQIKVGDIGVAEASNRISAATNAANVQRDILSDFGGKALAPGSKYYPNLGPSGPIASAAQVLGQPFGGFETTGQFPIDPNAIAAPISSAPGDSMLPRADAAVAAAQAALAGMGVPMKAEGGPVSGPYVSGEAGPELNFPTGGGQNYVMPLRDMMQGFGNRNGAGIQPVAGGSPFPIPGGGMPQGDPKMMLKDWAENVYRPYMMNRIQGMGGMGQQQDFSSIMAALQAAVQQARQRMMDMAGGAPTLPPSIPRGIPGLPPATGQGTQMRSPQMGLQAVARALGGG